MAGIFIKRCGNRLIEGVPSPSNIAGRRHIPSATRDRGRVGRAQVDVIVTWASRRSRGQNRATTLIPSVFAAQMDPFGRRVGC